MTNDTAIGYLMSLKIQAKDRENTSDICSALDVAIKALEERPQGEWITRTKDNGVSYYFYCSCCDREVIQITDYCPNCGADMRVKDELNRVKDELGGRE